jgi:hypothetical protein
LSIFDRIKVSGKTIEKFSCNRKIYQTISDFYKTPPVKMTFQQRVTNFFGAIATELVFGWWMIKPVAEALSEVYPNYDNTVGY